MENPKRETQRRAVQKLADTIATYNRWLDAGLKEAAAEYYFSRVVPAVGSLEAMGIKVTTPDPMTAGVSHMSAQMRVNF